jgi:hypothetical protein
MSSREDPHDDDNLTNSARLAELWSELLELRREVRQAEKPKKRKPVTSRSGSEGNWNRLSCESDD